jgi:hypothetical protein
MLSTAKQQSQLQTQSSPDTQGADYIVKFGRIWSSRQAKRINPMSGAIQTPRQIKWRFGPDWPGKRCCAKTRKGTPCQKPALAGKARCQLHGGRAGAPTGVQNGNYRHGQYTTEAVAAHHAAKTRVRALKRLAKTAGMLD